MKTTMRAILTDLTSEQKALIDNLMIVFGTAIRYSFKRLLEGKNIGDLEYTVSHKYNLNIRQSKDAIESARQTIASQIELINMYHENWTKKVDTIQKKLKNPKLSEKQIKALHSKLEKRQRKQAYWAHFIESNTFPPVIFGSKYMFIKRCKGLITKQEWQDHRNNRYYSRGDKTKNGNPNLRVVFKENSSLLEISTLEKTTNNRAIKVLMPIYLPQKLSKKTGKINRINYRKLFIDSINRGEAYQVELLKRDGKYHAHITFEELPAKVIHTGHISLLGIDTNPDGLGLTEVSKQGNLQGHTYLKKHELTFCRSNRRTNLCGELSAQAVTKAEKQHCGIAAEDLKFKDDRDVSTKLARVLHQFTYKTLLSMLERRCLRRGVEYTKVKPQFTSKIGLYKYCHQYGFTIHNGAALVIARRAYGLKETVPKLLLDKLINSEDKEKFQTKNEWSQWSTITKRIAKLFKQRKEVNTPGSWQANRKTLLGIT